MGGWLKRFQKRPFISTIRERLIRPFLYLHTTAVHPVPAQPSEQHGVIARQLDRLQAQGQLVATVDELAMMGGLSYLAARRQLERLTPRVVRLPGSASSFLIVPPEHQVRGAPPVAAWLDAYLQRRGQPYYLGLLSAAALHGASQQAVQVTQVITDFAIRPIDIGRLHLDFYVKHHVRKTPLSALPGLPAPLAVSTPEATALDLIAFNTRIGGIRRVAEVIAEMQSAFTVAGLRQALAAEQQTALKQRLGYVLEVLGMDRLAAEVRKVLPERCALAVLQTHARMRVSRDEAILPWMVVDNVGLKAQCA